MFRFQRNFVLSKLGLRMETEESDCGSDFDCNICLDAVREPVVTLCGHLFCWPCIYHWTNLRTNTNCPVCKSHLSHSTLVPIYGRGHASNDIPTPRLGSLIPRRPSGPVHDFARIDGSVCGPYAYYMPDPVTGVLCEMVYRRLFGDSSTGPLSPRLSRRAMQADQSLTRVYFFLVCSMIMCLLLF